LGEVLWLPFWLAVFAFKDGHGTPCPYRCLVPDSLPFLVPRALCLIFYGTAVALQHLNNFGL
jgi:hypothetical protein